MITFEHNGAVATIVLSRPPVNAINAAFVAAFHHALDEVEKLTPTIVVVRSDQRCFCAGADLALIGGFFDRPDGVHEMVAFVRSMHGLFDRIEAFPGVTLACMAGPALGGGLELALSCDLRIATRLARLGLPEAGIGMIPGAGGTQRLTRLCGPGVSSRVILGGEILDGAEAERLGVVQWCVDDADLDAAVGRTAGRISGLSRQALVASKDCILASLDPAADGYARELEKPQLLMMSEDSRARVARFLSSESR